MTHPNTKPGPVIGPAKVTDDHVQDRAVSKFGPASAWTKLSVLEKAHRSGKLMDKERCKTEAGKLAEAKIALDRYIAADRFAEGWALSLASWPSGSDLDRVRVVGCPGSFVDHQIDAKNFMRGLERVLGVNDWMILRRVCGENYAIADTVLRITPAYKFSSLARFRESLDALIDAIPKALEIVSRGKSHVRR